MEYTIRLATPIDIQTIMNFTIHEAQESQGAEIDAIAVERGVLEAFNDNPRSCYWVVEDTKKKVIASTSIIKERSDFQGNDYWWIQSFYITPEHRGKGLADQMITHLRQEAKLAKALELRLYVHNTNKHAVRAYQRNGFSPSSYTIMQMSL